MAIAAPRICAVPKCGKPNCQEHQVEKWRTRSGPAPQRIRGRALQRMRIRLFARAPWCVTCLEAGRQRAAVIRDHKVPLAEGGLDDETNEQGLCQDCSDAKTREESKRGVRRWPNV
jgi:Restriction endonuclease